jgi:hypothetical protein
MPIKPIDYNNYVTPSDYIKFEQGINTVQIISKGGMCKMHGMRTGRGYVNLGMCTETSECEQCIKGAEPKTRWLWVVYSHDIKQVRVMEVGKMVGDAICKIAKNKDINNYLLTIHRAGDGLKTKYEVNLGKLQPLSDEDKAKYLPEKEFLIKKHFM